VTGLPTIVAVPEHVTPVKKLYVTVPPTWNPPVIVAESNTEPPTMIGFADKVVVIEGLVLLTVNGSQALVAGLLLASPL
jgi:hypothetical protein